MATPRTKECLLCTKHLSSRPRHNDQAAKLYSDILIRLLKFSLVNENGWQCTSSSNSNNQQASTSTNLDLSLKLNDHSHSDAVQNEQNFLTTLEKSLVQFSYCLDCVHSIRRVNGRLKELHKIQHEIVEYKDQVIKLLLDQCLEGDDELPPRFSLEETKPSMPEAESTPLSVISVQAVRRTIVKGFNLQKYSADNQALNRSINLAGPEQLQLQPTRNLSVRLTRLEQTPQMLANLGNVVVDEQGLVRQLGRQPATANAPCSSPPKRAQNIKIELDVDLIHESTVSTSASSAAAYQAKRAGGGEREEDPFLDTDYEMGSPSPVRSCSSDDEGAAPAAAVDDFTDDVDVDFDYQLPKSEPRKRKPSKKVPDKRRIKSRNLRSKKKVEEECPADEEAEAEEPKIKKSKTSNGKTGKSSYKQSSYPCNVDGCKFISKAWMETYNHTITVHGRQALKKQFPCSYCSAQFYRADSLVRHQKTKHQQSWSCTKCSSSGSEAIFPTYPDYKLHLKEHDRKERLTCPTCSYQTKDFSTLQMHQSVVHNKERNYMCQYCGLDFTSGQRLKYHYGSKHPELNLVPNPDQYKCQHCERIFACPPTLRQHIRTVHLKQYNIHCEVCGKGFIHRGKLQQHMIIQHGTGEKPFECETCHSKFANKSRLDQHMQRHTGKFRFTCKVCSKGFIESKGLKRHEQIHEGILRYFCEICSKGFPVRNYLYMHMRSHETVEERAERLKKSGEKELPALSKLYNQLRRNNVTTATVQVLDDENSDSRASAGPQPRIEEYPMIYDYRRERKTISGFVQPQPEEDQQ